MLNKLEDPLAISRRGKLMLPPPQVTDHELEQVVKASTTASLDDGSGADATRLLLHSYEHTPASTAGPQRTPRMGGGSRGGAY